MKCAEVAEKNTYFVRRRRANHIHYKSHIIAVQVAFYFDDRILFDHVLKHFFGGVFVLENNALVTKQIDLQDTRILDCVCVWFGLTDEARFIRSFYLLSTLTSPLLLFVSFLLSLFHTIPHLLIHSLR